MLAHKNNAISQLAESFSHTVTFEPLGKEAACSANTATQRDPNLERIIEEMSFRATNLGYGLGHALGSVLGNFDNQEYILPKENETPPHSLFYSIWNWGMQKIYAILNKISNELLEIGDFSFPDISESSELSSQHKDFFFISELPQAVVVKGFDFPPSLKLELEKSKKKFPEVFGKYNQSLNELSKRYSIQQFEIRTVSQLCDALVAAKKKGPIKFLIINVHGSNHGFKFSEDDQSDGQITLEEYLNILNKKNELDCLTQNVEEDVIIVLYACSSANDLPFRSKKWIHDYYISLNMQKLIALYVPKGIIFAAEHKILTDSIKIEFEPYLQVKYLDLEGSQYIKMQLEVEENKEYLKELIESAFLEMQPLNLEKSGICQDPLIYSQMKKYCDNAKITPIKKENLGPNFLYR